MTPEGGDKESSAAGSLSEEEIDNLLKGTPQGKRTGDRHRGRTRKDEKSGAGSVLTEQELNQLLTAVGSGPGESGGSLSRKTSESSKSTISSGRKDFPRTRCGAS